MKKLYSIAFLLTFVLVSGQAAVNTFALGIGSLGVTDTSKRAIKSTLKLSDGRKDKQAFIQKGLDFEITPFKPLSVKPVVSGNTIASTNTVNSNKSLSQDYKVVSNVKVYPNPVAEQLNLTYNVSKDSNVTIKIMDVLGNEIATLLSQKMQAGDQTSSFNINNRLNSGYYFIRLIVGNETIVKRISVL